MPFIPPARKPRDILSGGGDDSTGIWPGGTPPPNTTPSPTGNGGGSSGGSSSGNGGGSSGNGGGSSNGIPGATSISGSPGGQVFGPANVPHRLSDAAIAAILLGILLALAVAAVCLRALWLKRRERRGSTHVEKMPYRPQHADRNASFSFDPQMAERLRGGVIEPYTGAASADSLSTVYRIEPFAVPPRRPAHARTASSAWLLAGSDPAVLASPASTVAAGRAEKAPRPTMTYTQPDLPRGAMNLPHHGHTFSGLTPLATPMGSPAANDDMVFELPPTYASLAQPRPVRRWYQFWPQSPPSRHGSGGSGGSGGAHASRSGSL